MSTIKAYYNDNDANVCAWTRELIKAGLITDGDVDERPCQEVSGKDLVGYDRVHFFSGICGWDLALNIARWGDRPIWTMSCPCQPFSAAGKGAAQEDERHLWPEMFRLIRECRPDCVIGEQVEAAIGKGWLDGICDDLERENYAVGKIILPACCTGKGLYETKESGEEIGSVGSEICRLVAAAHGPDVATEFRRWWRASGYYAQYDCDHNSAPHIRQRIFWVADATRGGFGIDGRTLGQARHADECGTIDGLGDSQGERCGEARQCSGRSEKRTGGASIDGFDGMAVADEGQCGRFADGQGCERDGATTGREQGNGLTEPCGNFRE